MPKTLSSKSELLKCWNGELPKAVLFDHDGVLVASEPLQWEAWAQLLREMGMPYHEEDLRKRVGKTAPEILGSLLDQYRPGWQEGDGPSDYNLAKLSLRKNDFYLENAKHKLRAYPNVAEGLRKLKERGVICIVVSNAKRRELENGLKMVGIFDYFDDIISRDEAKKSKPDPTPYLMGAACAGFEPHECLAIEDSPTGLEAALLAKVPAVGVLTNFDRTVLNQPVPGRPDLKPAWIAESMTELFRALGLLG
jgi:beta-phosphoglucomutase